MQTKQLLEQVLATFDNNDPQRLLELVTEDFEWSMIGAEVTKGKENLRQMFAEGGNPQMAASTKDHIVIDGNTAVCDGVVTMKFPDGRTVNEHYCDIYEFEGELLKKMTTYMVTPK